MEGTCGDPTEEWAEDTVVMLDTGWQNMRTFILDSAIMLDTGWQNMRTFILHDPMTLQAISSSSDHVYSLDMVRQIFLSVRKTY